MRIIYQAFDGRNFYDEESCEIYEFKKLHPSLFTIDLYNDKNEKIHFSKSKDDLWNDKYYHYTEKVEIHNTAELSDFLLLSKDCGWCEFEEQINDIGFWERTEDEVGNGIWVKKK